MFRALLRLVVVVVVLVAAAAFFLGYWGSNRLHPSGASSATVGTTGKVDTERAREAGAKVGEKTAEAANKAGALLADGALTAKIKSKMALDDSVRSRTIDVTTAGHVVTVSGHVRTEAEHTRALQLARETAGVTQVVDRITVDGR
jgi:osmotically-inducible protein OsmY